MKGLTLSQPWATLVAIGAKTIETRSWKTDYRGWIAIHAARDETHQQMVTARHPAFVDKLRAAGYEFPLYHNVPWNVPRGVIVAVCRIADCVRVETLEGTPISVYEYAFGDYTPGQWAWRLADVRRLTKPVRCKGAQRFWDLPPDVLNRLDAYRGEVAR